MGAGLADRQDLLPLRIRLAELLCRAPDYWDQVGGIEEKASALRKLLTESGLLTPEESLQLRQARDAHARAFAAFPAERTSLLLTPDGMSFRHSPDLLPGNPPPGGPAYSLSRDGPSVLQPE